MDVAEFLKLRYGIEEFSNAPEGGKIVDPSNDADRRKIFEALIPGLVDFVQQMKMHPILSDPRRLAGGAKNASGVADGCLYPYSW